MSASTRWEPDAMVSVTDAARMLSRSPGRVRQYIEQGRLSAVRIGGSFVLSRREVEGFVARPSGRPQKREPEAEKEGL